MRKSLNVLQSKTGGCCFWKILKLNQAMPTKRRCKVYKGTPKQYPLDINLNRNTWKMSTDFAEICLIVYFPEIWTPFTLNQLRANLGRGSTVVKVLDADEQIVGSILSQFLDQVSLDNHICQMLKMSTFCFSIWACVCDDAHQSIQSYFTAVWTVLGYCKLMLLTFFFLLLRNTARRFYSMITQSTILQFSGSQNINCFKSK